MAKNIKLKVKTEYQLTILGIVSAESILKLSWAINHSLHIQLSQSNNLVQAKKNTNQIIEFSFYQFEDEILMIKYSLVKNRMGTFCYFDELRNVDYIFFIHGETDSKFRESVLQLLKQTPEINSMLAIDSSKLKLKDKIELF